MIDPQDQSIGRETRTVRQYFTEDKLNSIREQFANAALKRDDKEEEFLALRKTYKLEIDGIKAEAKTLAKDIRNRFRDDMTECWLVPNFEAGMMEFYAIGTGEKVDERRMRPDERQMNIQHADTYTR